MIASIRQVTEIATSKMRTIAALNDLSLKSAHKISQTSDMIRGVSAKFNEMLEIISIIDGISTTVKIVSINASIEATHAGKFGSGFQVLAREINKLSESTRQNAESIAQTLQSVISLVKGSIEASQESTASYQEQEQSVRELLVSLKTISELMGQLDSNSSQILSVMEKK
jgi:methyl-accepting chemotaxis protein